MKLIFAPAGIAALGGIALATAPAAAPPVTIPGQASQASNVEQADYVCDPGGTAGAGRLTATVTIMAVGAGIAAGEDTAGTTGIRITMADGDLVDTNGITGDAGASAPFWFSREAGTAVRANTKSARIDLRADSAKCLIIY